MKKISCIGQGFVGGTLSAFFEKISPVKYDPFKEGFVATKEDVNRTDIAFVCVGTPMKDDKTCDTSQIEEVFSWLTVPIAVIKSTVPPGTCEQLQKKYPQIRIVHNPEFLREQTALEDIKNVNRTVLGGDKKDCIEVARVYQQIYNHDMQYIYTDTTTSELVKYATNCYLSSKVTFCNEMATICNTFGVDYDLFKEIWLLEPRISRTHTIISEVGGFGGHCFPKDLNALIEYSVKHGYNPKFLKAVWNSNCKFREEFRGKEYND